MSLENWDNLAEGSSLEDIVRRAEAEKEQKLREEQAISPVPVPVEPVKSSKSMWGSRLWRSRSENFAQVKPPKAPVIDPGSPALEHQKALLTGKKPDVIPPPFVIVSSEDRVRSSIDDVAPKYQIQSMNILGLDVAPANDDALSKATKGKKWKKMLSWRKPDPSKVIGVGKFGRKHTDSDSENGVYHEGAAKGVTASTETDVCSWPENRMRSTLAEDVDSAIERAERHEKWKDPLDSGIGMLLNNANPDIIRKVLSADAEKVDQETGNPVDFANVEFENDDAVQIQTALMSRDAVLENIYSGRTPSKSATPLQRSATHTDGVADGRHIEPSSSFLDILDRERTTHERSKRRASFFHRKKGKDSLVQAS